VDPVKEEVAARVTINFLVPADKDNLWAKLRKTVAAFAFVRGQSKFDH
jgi:hypothetical protein